MSNDGDGRPLNPDHFGCVLPYKMPYPPGKYMVRACRLCPEQTLAWWDASWIDVHDGALPEYLFRGQDNVHRRHWPPDGEHGIEKHAYVLDSLMGSDFRGIEEMIAALGWHHPRVELLGGPVLTQLRWLIMEVLFENYLNLACLCGFGETALGLVRDLHSDPGCDARHIMTAIGQHCELPSHLLDWTASFRVALYMAMRDLPDLTEPVGESVWVYCVDTSSSSWQAAQAKYPFVSFVQADRPALEQVTVRPKRQMGWSLVNAEHPAHQLELWGGSALVVYEVVRPFPESIVEAMPGLGEYLLPEDNISVWLRMLNRDSSEYDPGFMADFLDRVDLVASKAGASPCLVQHLRDSDMMSMALNGIPKDCR